MYQFEQLHRELQQYCRQGFTPIANMEDLEPGQLVIVDTDLKDGPRWRRGVVTRIMPRYRLIQCRAFTHIRQVLRRPETVLKF